MSVATATAIATANQGGPPPRGALVPGRLGGIGGLVFVAALVVQNALRANAPGFAASPGKVTAYFVNHRAAALIPLGMFPIEMLALFAFVTAVWARAGRQESRWWATVGILGATAIAALFAIVNIIEIVLTAKAESLATSPGVVQALWTLRGGAFGLDLAAIAVALIGLSRAAASSALIPVWLGAVTFAGAGCLLVAATFTVSLANGGAWLVLGLVGFVCWLVFMAAASISLLRKSPVL